MQNAKSCGILCAEATYFEIALGNTSIIANVSGTANTGALVGSLSYSSVVMQNTSIQENIVSAGNYTGLIGAAYSFMTMRYMINMLTLTANVTAA